MNANRKKKRIFRYFIITNDEEKFINNMFSKGWKISDIKYGCIYEFDECEPNEYICRTIFLFEEDGESINMEKNVIIREMLEDQNAEILDIKFRKHIIYVLRKSKEGAFEINSDINSKINEYKIRKKSNQNMSLIAAMFGCIFLANAIWASILEFAIALVLYTCSLTSHLHFDDNKIN